MSEMCIFSELQITDADYLCVCVCVCALLSQLCSAGDKPHCSDDRAQFLATVLCVFKKD